MVARARQSFNLGCTRPLEWRRKQLLQLVLMIDEQQKAFEEAVFKDLHKPASELWSAELLMARNDAIDAIDSTPSPRPRSARARAFSWARACSARAHTHTQTSRRGRRPCTRRSPSSA